LTRLNAEQQKSRTNRSDVKPAPEVAPVAVEAEMSSEEYRAMIELAKNAGPDDCEMCGS
jgi:ribonucleoside-diphosphate reductase alpha chain